MTNYFRYHTCLTEQPDTIPLCTSIDLDSVKSSAIKAIYKNNVSYYYPKEEDDSIPEEEYTIADSVIDFVPFFFISTNTEQLAEYLLPNGVSRLTIAAKILVLLVLLGLQLLPLINLFLHGYRFVHNEKNLDSLSIFLLGLTHGVLLRQNGPVAFGLVVLFLLNG